VGATFIFTFTLVCVWWLAFYGAKKLKVRLEAII